MSGANPHCHTSDGQRPDDPVARWSVSSQAECHCGEILDPSQGIEIDGAPGPVVQCQGCGCHVAVPPLDVAIESP